MSCVCLAVILERFMGSDGSGQSSAEACAHHGRFFISIRRTRSSMSCAAGTLALFLGLDMLLQMLERTEWDRVWHWKLRFRAQAEQHLESFELPWLTEWPQWTYPMLCRLWDFDKCTAEEQESPSSSPSKPRRLEKLQLDPLTVAMLWTCAFWTWVTSKEHLLVTALDEDGLHSFRECWGPWRELNCKCIWRSTTTGFKMLMIFTIYEATWHFYFTFELWQGARWNPLALLAPWSV